jgi:hypothetical protein
MLFYEIDIVIQEEGVSVLNIHNSVYLVSALHLCEAWAGR